jgi:hypothetical protein
MSIGQRSFIQFWICPNKATEAKAFINKVTEEAAFKKEKG